MIIVDASAVIAVLLATTRSRSVLDRIAGGTETLHAPHLLDIEVANGLRRYSRLGEISRSVAERCLADFHGLRIERHAHSNLLPRIWDLRQNLTAYDAAYVALAELLDCPVLTTDARLSRAGGHRARIELMN
jgi:predicted nucleic acid-binding protein